MKPDKIQSAQDLIQSIKSFTASPDKSVIPQGQPAVNGGSVNPALLQLRQPVPAQQPLKPEVAAKLKLGPVEYHPAVGLHQKVMVQ